ncbi:MAG: L,D-transpeptidase [Actinomycetota bacterium]|nr:L,D-transpeptidase [Actinomycetota bacterium]
MRRTAVGLAGLILVVLSASLLAAGRIAVAHRHAVPQRAPVASPPPAPGVTDAPRQPATLLDTVVASVPASITQLASPKSSTAGLAYSDAPGGHIVGSLSATSWGGPAVRPVIQTQGRWLQVRLDSRPNGSTGWISRLDVTLLTTGYRIVISVSQRTLTLYQNGTNIYAAPVGVGRSQWPTPIGPSYVDAVVPVPANQQYVYGPVIVITAAHSDVLTNFDGGDGTVAIHGYPSDPASTAGVASSHGCIRSSPETMAAIAKVSPGTPIDINP